MFKTNNTYRLIINLLVTKHLYESDLAELAYILPTYESWSSMK